MTKCTYTMPASYTLLIASAPLPVSRAAELCKRPALSTEHAVLLTAEVMLQASLVNTAVAAQQPPALASTSTHSQAVVGSSGALASSTLTTKTAC